MSTLSAVDNATTVTRLYEAFGRGDIPFIIDHLADNCQWIGTGKGYMPAGGTYVGKNVLNFFKTLGETVEFTSFNPISINNINDHEVIALGNMSGISKATGKSSSTDWAMHWKFNDEGKAVYFHEYYDTVAGYMAQQK
jgi:ketosteroid isomerase-like protein